MNSEMNIDVCSYTDLTPEKLLIKAMPYDKDKFTNYISIKKNKKELLFVLTPWIKKINNYSGIVTNNFGGNPIEYPDEFRIDIDEDDDSNLDFINKIKDIDTYFMSDEFKKKYLPKYYQGKYWSTYNENQKWIKAKLQYKKEEDNKKLIINMYNTFSYPNKPNIFYKKKIENVTNSNDIKKLIKKNTNFRVVLLPTSIWYNNNGYGIRFKIYEIQIGTNSKDFNYSENN
jgi:hypothetical protein